MGGFRSLDSRLEAWQEHSTNTDRWREQPRHSGLDPEIREHRPRSGWTRRVHGSRPSPGMTGRGSLDDYAPGRPTSLSGRGAPYSGHHPRLFRKRRVAGRPLRFRLQALDHDHGTGYCRSQPASRAERRPRHPAGRASGDDPDLSVGDRGLRRADPGGAGRPRPAWLNNYASDRVEGARRGAVGTCGGPAGGNGGRRPSRLPFALGAMGGTRAPHILCAIAARRGAPGR